MENTFRKFVYRCGQFFENKRRSGTTSFLKKLSDENQGKIWILCAGKKESLQFGNNGMYADQIIERGNSHFFEDRPILVDNHFLLGLCQLWQQDMDTKEYIIRKNMLFLEQIQFMVRDFQNGKLNPLKDDDSQRRLERGHGSFMDFKL